MEFDNLPLFIPHYLPIPAPMYSLTPASIRDDNDKNVHS